MAQTVIGFFDNASDAQRALERLESIGISRQHVDLSSGNRDNVGTTNASSDRSEHDGENGITRFFKSLFGSDNDDAERYSRVGQNSTIVTVHAQSADQAQRAADLLDECGAVDVDERAAQYGYRTGAQEGPARDNISDSRREINIPRVQEDLEVGKRTEERGGVRVRSRIVERPVEEHVRLREEHINVERQPVDRPVSDRDMQNLRDGEIELRERAEVPVVNKQARVVEEVKVSKNVEQRDETVRDTVRNTEIDVDKLNRNERRNDLDENNTTSRGDL